MHGYKGFIVGFIVLWVNCPDSILSIRIISAFRLNCYLQRVEFLSVLSQRKDNLAHVLPEKHLRLFHFAFLLCKFKFCSGCPINFATENKKIRYLSFKNLYRKLLEA